ncbi:uncharacterized protein LOC120357490 isoform X2 [Solenopsis invicta]|uniref:uncharacterized protein LOC120357490 isoform X2 n=1 Tax=Solenopsis invicta TaxID=13686 RepID=UPI00193D4393|nr:uncharacterized protein LOC120357490 isoform X2 [Solenopsis invicta]
MLTQSVINLPRLERKVELGIYKKSSLTDAKKLPIYHPAGKIAPHALVKQNAILWAYKQFQDLDAKRIFVNGVAGILDFGLIRRVETTAKPDGDWIKTYHHEAYDQLTANEVMKIINPEDINKGINLVIATKANFWLRGHHIEGQDLMAHCVKKTILGYNEKATDQMISAVYSLGQFCSTLYVLTLAGILHIRPTTEVTSSNGAVFKMSANVKLWFSSMPAGVEDFKSLPELKAKVMMKPAFYHINASYLTGVERKYADTDNEEFLGRLGIFINTLYKNSTLAKSPHIAISKLVNYYDYDANFKANLVAILQKQKEMHVKITEEIFEHFEPFRVTPQTTINLVHQAFLADTTADLQLDSSGTATSPPTKQTRLS